MRLSKLILLALPLILFTGCEEQGDVAAANNAQACFDKADETDQTAVLDCLDYIEGIYSTEAEVVRCSILLTAGGVTSDRMSQAIADQESNGGDSAMMTNFSFNKYGSAAENKSKVKEAKDSCKNSGVSGLVGLSSFASTGTLLCKGASTCSNANETQVDQLLSDCSSASNGCSQEDKEEIGDTAILMNEVYCNNGESDAEECQALANALDGVDLNDPDAVADAVLAEWQAQ